jgi:hypothetical protein
MAIGLKDYFLCMVRNHLFLCSTGEERSGGQDKKTGYEELQYAKPRYVGDRYHHDDKYDEDLVPALFADTEQGGMVFVRIGRGTDPAGF